MNPPPQKLNSFTCLTVNNCACIFAHKRCEYAEVSWPATTTDAGGGALLSSSRLVSAPGLDRLDYTLSVTVLYILIATVFAEGGR